jgi:hypothetical protein
MMVLAGRDGLAMLTAVSSKAIAIIRRRSSSGQPKSSDITVFHGLPAAKLGNIRKDCRAKTKVSCESLVARINILPDGPSLSSFPSGPSDPHSSRSMQWLFLCCTRRKIVYDFAEGRIWNQKTWPVLE